MNHKNPFAVPQTAYTPQPPLPPGPPPPQPAQPDYSAYWAAAAAAQAQQAATPGYNPQWAVQPGQPAAQRPTPEQSALFANYGYGGQQWQQQQQRPPQHFQPQPPPPPAQAPPPPPQPAYNPYQPQAGVYQQPYVPQAAPPQQIPPQVPYVPQAPVVQQFQQQQQPFFPQHQQQQQQQNRNNNRHNQHNSSQHLPPAKRQRFDGPSQHRAQPPPPPQFQPPPPPGQQQPPTGPIGGGVGVGINASQSQNFSGGRGGGPGANQVPLGGGRGGFSGRGGNINSRGRGGMGMGRGGRGGGRGGTYNSMNGRGGGPGQNGSFRAHGSGRGFGNRDNRRGGSFAGGGQNYSHQQQQQPQQGLPQQPQQQQNQQNFNGSFRGRHQNFARGARHDTSGLPHGPKEMTASSGFSAGKKEENRRTLTDFKIVGLRIAALGWNWGVVPKEFDAADSKEEPEEANAPPSELEVSEKKPEVDALNAPAASSSDADTVASAAQAESGDDAVVKPEGTSATVLPPPPSRIRIYFHTPVTADDAHPITSQGSFSLSQGHDSVVRKGKRKKLEDDDGDLEDGRGPPPPPPQHSGFEHDASSTTFSADLEGANTTTSRASVAPSVTETASEGDWLMAAISEEVEGDGNTDAHASDGDNLHDIDAEGEPDDYDDGNDFDDVDAQMGGIDDGQSHVSAEGLLDENAPSYEGVAIPSGHNGQNAPVDGSRVESDHESSLQSTVPEGPNGSAVASFSASIQPSATPNSTASNAAAEHVVPTAEAAMDADKTASTQTQPAVAPFQATELQETIPNPEEQEVTTQLAAGDTTSDTQANGHLDVPVEETQLLEFELAPEHPPSPSLSAATTVLPSVTNGAGQLDDTRDAQPTKVEPARVPSANRLSISYAAATRRLVIDAGVVEKLKVYRQDARIEVHMNIEKDKIGQYKGIFIEGVSDSSATYHPLELSAESGEDDTVPPFSTATLPLHTVLTAYLDKARPLSEPRWVKTGDVQDWLKSMFGRMFWVAGDAADGWEKKIEVVDADPPPTIWTVLEAWAVNSNIGTQTERQRFLRTHMTETDNILEILLRLVRGERASYSQSTPVISTPSVSGPLLSALSQGSAHGAQQTHVSLAVLAIFRLATEFAKRAENDEGKTEVEARVGEIIRCLPSHLIYKSLDGIFKEWRLEKKGGR